MAIDFPASPIDGQVFTDTTSGNVYKWYATPGLWREVPPVVPTGLITLTSDTTYYVRTDGNDANNGLANASGGAFRTIRRSMDQMAKINANGFAVTIIIQHGTYSESSLGTDNHGYEVTACMSVSTRPVNCGNFSILSEDDGDYYRTKDWVVFDLDSIAPIAGAGQSRVGIALNGVVVDALKGFTITSQHATSYGGGFYPDSTQPYGVMVVNSLVEGATLHLRNLVVALTVSKHSSLEVQAYMYGWIFNGWMLDSYSYLNVHSYITIEERLSLKQEYAWCSAQGFCNVNNVGFTEPTYTVGDALTLVDNAASVQPYALAIGSRMNRLDMLPGGGVGYADLSSGSYNDPAKLITLTSATTYYVRTDGNDANQGLWDVPNGAFLTIKRAMQQMHSIDANGYAVTIQIGDGTWTEKTGGLSYSNNHTFVMVCQKRPINCSIFSILGNLATPANCVLDAYAATANRCILVSNGTLVENIAGFKFEGGGSKGGILVFANSCVNFLTSIILSANIIGIYAKQFSRVGYGDVSVSGVVSSAVYATYQSTIEAVVEFKPGSSILSSGVAVTAAYHSQAMVTAFSPENCTPVAGSKKFSVSILSAYSITGVLPGELAGTADTSCFNF
jgi:hypothetical protein